MKNVLILRYGEIYLKGKNRAYFENVLVSNIKNAIKDFQFVFRKTTGRYVVCDYEPEKEGKLISKLKNVFGLVSLSKAIEIETDIKEIENFLRSIRVEKKTFRVSVKRADKTFPIKSVDYEPILGGYVLDSNPNLIVSLKNPELEITVEIRENKKTYIVFDKVDCVGGMPVGTAGKGLLMLSGGIDSPVAGYMMAKRGLKLYALHFHSYPYTSELAKEKVLSLASILERYNGRLKVFCVPFTQIQEAIHKFCKEEYMITIMRRIMLRIAEKLCEKHGFGAIVTGESLAQVASQTVEGITSSNSVLSLIPVFRPLIGMDKKEIIEIAEKIGTFETSILPYEDCCTVFLPKNPLIKPKLSLVEKEEDCLDIENLIDEAIKNIELIG